MRRSLALITAFIFFCCASFAQPQPQTSQGSSQDDVSVPPLTVPQRDYSEVLKSGHGEIVIWFKVRKDGGVDGPLALYNEPVSMNFANRVHPELERLALATVQKWKYSPLLLNGKPIEVRTEVALTFEFQRPAETLQNSLAEASPSSSSSNAAGPAKPPLTQRSRIQPDEEIVREMKIKNVNPEYPQAAKLAHVQGEIVIHFRIDKEGHVMNVTAEKGSPMLVQATMEAVKQWEYKPFVLDGKPVEIESTATVKFHM